MGKTRVYKLARELDMESKELVEILQGLGLEITSHMSTVDDETSQLVKDMLTEEEEESKEEDVKTKDREETEADDSDVELQEIETPITVKELAETVDKATNEVIKMLMNKGVMASLNQELDAGSVELLSDELNITVEMDTEVKDETEDEYKKVVGPKIEDKPEDLEPRPPIITVMGHVDHGKTTLLDVIRKTRVAENEAGGITQHIGAYQVTVNGEKISFIDTPGHEAFTEMRARGAKVTDIVILVVAADDGVMPQTEEAIHHAQAAEIPIVVAINKIDKPNAQPDRVKQELTEHGLVPEEWGGSTICVPISALKEENIDELLEMVLLVAEMQEIKANPDRSAEGIVVEAELDKGKGPIATVLVKNGTLRVGDPLICGYTYGRVRAMQDETGKRVEEAPPSTPVVVLGFSDVPQAGDYMQVLEDERLARDTAEERRQRKHKKEIAQDTTVSLEDLYDRIQEGELKELNVIIKGDVQGSIEALKGSLNKLGTDEVSINIMHTGVGAITETDVNLANASKAIIIGFNVRPDSNARRLAEKEKVDIRTYRVIYKVIDDLKDAMAGLLEPELKEEVKGRIEVRATFKVPDVGIIAGSFVREGIVNRNYHVRVIRDGVVVHEGEISSLKRFENDVREVKEGYECGIGIENFNDIKVGDVLEVYTYREIKRSL